MYEKQYPHRSAALKALRRITSFSTKTEGKELSQAETWLIGRLLYLKEIRDDRKRDCFKKDPEVEREYRLLKGISRSLNLFPVSEEHKNYIKVLNRMNKLPGFGY